MAAVDDDAEVAANSVTSSPSPPNLSFRVLEATGSSRFQFIRSISSKEPTATSDFPTPDVVDLPRLSFSHVQHHLSSPLSPYQAASAVAATAARLANSFNGSCTYRFISSVLKRDGQILSMSLSNNLVYVGNESNVIRVYKLPELIECDRLKTNTSKVVALLATKSSNYVYAAYSDNNIRVWRRTLEASGVKHVRVATMPKSAGYVRSYIAGKDRTQSKHMGPITSMSVDIDGDVLYSASIDTTVKVWRISDLRCVETFKAHQEPVNAVVAASEGILYTASDDATVRVWHRHSFTSGHSLALTLPAKNSPVKALTLAPLGDVLYGGCTDGYIHYWLRAKGSTTFACQLQYSGALQGHEHAVLCMANSGNYLVSGSADSTVRIWCKKPHGGHECVTVMVAHRGPVRCVSAYSEHVDLDGDGSDNRGSGFTICTGSLDGALKQWRVAASTSDGGSRGIIQGANSKSGKDYFELN